MQKFTREFTRGTVNIHAEIHTQIHTVNPGPSVRPSDRLAGRPTDRSTDRPYDLPSDLPTARPTDHPVSSRLIQPSGQISALLTIRGSSNRSPRSCMGDLVMGQLRAGKLYMRSRAILRGSVTFNLGHVWGMPCECIPLLSLLDLESEIFMQILWGLLFVRGAVCVLRARAPEG